jgi:chaperone modulatory protein CbpM
MRWRARRASTPTSCAGSWPSGSSSPIPSTPAARIARAARLRRDLGLNYAGAVLACELLARIDELQRRLSRYESR